MYNYLQAHFDKEEEKNKGQQVKEYLPASLLSPSTHHSRANISGGIFLSLKSISFESNLGMEEINMKKSVCAEKFV